MRQKRAFVPSTSVYPHQGLNTANPTTQIDPKFTPETINVAFRRGQIKKRRGYATLGGALNGTIMAIIRFEVSAGVVKTVAVTTTKMYVLAAGSWSDITLQVTGSDVNWTGDTNDIVDWVVGTDAADTWLIVTNGKDAPRKWNGTGRFVAHGFNLSFTTCKTLAIFKGSLVLGNIDSDQGKTIAWSDIANFTEFTTGAADAQILTDSDGDIVRMLPLADSLAVYTANSITMISFIGGDIVYSIVKVVDNTRLLSGRAVVSIGPFHCYCSEENIYFFDGSRQFRPLADIVQEKYRGELDLANAKQAHAFYDGIETTALFSIPTQGGGVTTYVMEINLLDFFFPQQLRWYRYMYTNGPRTFGYLTRDSTLLWNDTLLTTLTWRQAQFLWNDSSTKQGFPQLVFGSGSQVYLTDGVTPTDAGAPITAYVDTIDFTVPTEYVSENGRWIEVEMELRGFEVKVAYSLDQGLNFSFFGGSDAGMGADGIQPLTSEFTRYRFFCDAVSKYFRVRIANNTTGGFFERRHFKVWVAPSGTW